MVECGASGRIRPSLPTTAPRNVCAETCVPHRVAYLGLAMKMNQLCATVLVAAAGWIGAVAVQAAEKGVKRVEAAAGEEFTVSMEANHTTGFAWQLAKPLDGAVVKKIRNIYQEDNHPVPMEGVGGVERWTFKAVRAGKTTIEFKYVQAWEADKEPAKTAKYHVTVK